MTVVDPDRRAPGWRLMKQPRCALALVLLIAGINLGQGCKRDAPPAGELDEIGVRNAHTMAWHPDRRMVLLFGGADEAGVHGDTWEREGTVWRRLTTDGPVPRTFANMAYDRARGEILLFGGNRVLFGREPRSDTFLDDLWRFEGARWHQIPVSGPRARAEACMAYDAGRSRTVLFGGYFFEHGEYIRLYDTWEWDGEEWHQFSAPGPPAQNGCSMVYDEARDVIVLWGQDSARVAGETWEWDGRSWRAVLSAGAPRRYNAAMAYDPVLESAFRFGGWDGDKRTGDTWAFDGKTWELLRISGPGPRNHAAMVFDSERQQLVLFGGHNGDEIFGDVWTLADRRWQQVRQQQPLRRVNNGH